MAGSVASIGSVAVFQRRTRRTIFELEKDEVAVRKGDRGVPGSKTFVTNRAAATKPLSSKFLGSYHLQSKNANGENVQKSKHIQEEFVSNLMVMKELKERVLQYDMRGPLQVPAQYYDIVGEDAWEGRWDTSNPDRVIVDLTTHWGSVTLDHVLKWQVDFNGYSEAEDMISSIWLKELLTSSMDVELRRQVKELEQELDLYQRGGITYFKLVVDTLFKMSSMAEDSLQCDFNGYSEAEDMISSIWLKDLLTSLMDVELRRQVEEIVQQQDLYKWGGIAYYKIVVDTVFKMSTVEHAA